MRYLLTLLLALCGCCAFSQGNTSNQGKEFWTTYMSHVEDNGVSQMSLYITSDVNTSGTVEIADGSFNTTFTVAAKAVTIIDIPHTALIKPGGKFLKGIHITSLKNIAVYAHIFARNVSGATLLLPVNVLSKNYTSINYTQVSNARSYSTLAVVATEDNTTVDITPSTNLTDGNLANQKFQVTLQKGEVYQALANADLTSSLIRSVSSSTGECKKIAVFSGSSKIAIGCNSSLASSDNLFQQVYPTSSWGKNYITVPLKSRVKDIFRIVLSDVNTVVKLNGTTLTNPSPFYEFESDQPNVITADKPVQVVQYAVTQGNTQGPGCGIDRSDTGDPEMIYLSPLEQTLDHVTLYSTSAYDIINNFINVVVKTTAVPTFMLDGQPYADLVSANSALYKPFVAVPGQPDYSYVQINVLAGTHYINANEGFNAIVYGFGNLESYGYAAGTNLQNLDQNIVITDTISNQAKTSGCAGISYKLQLTIPYQTTRIKWDFKDGTAPYMDNSPVVKSTIQKNDKTLYTYEYYKTVNFKPGDYTVTGTVFNPTSDDCGSDVPVDFDFTISDFPSSKFTWANNCAGDSTFFKDKTSTADAFNTWLWDFGDGETSALQNPKHIYAKGGNYTVKLTVANESGCSSTSDSTIVILNKPKAVFNLQAPYCYGQNVVITDASTSASGIIKQWIWNFGDGTAAETRTDNKPFIHIFSKTGADTVKLTVITENGCSDAIQKMIVVNVLPVADFSLPDVCLADAAANFTDKSAIPDNSGSFTYLWNFGDANANAANPNTSTQRNPSHKYTRADNYLVTLTVTSANDCPASKTQTLTVNGDIPKALFSVDNKDQLCSAKPVVFRDLSSVNFGNFTKVVWYYDYLNSPAVSEVYNKANLPVGRIYTHSYGVFNAPLTKTYTVRMEAYSGETCVDVAQQTITVNANPLVNLGQVGSICFEAPPLQIVVDKNGFTGNGVFSGKGITPGGIFTPSTAGAGLTTISYTFTAVNGCDYTTTENIIVYNELKADAGESLTILEGESTVLKGASNQSGVTYRWIPSIGLDHNDVAGPVASPVEDTDYKLTVTNANGCTSTDEVLVHVLKKLVVVNTFTPNNDGINDIWNIKYLENYPGSTVDIYNRWGERLYSSVGYAIPWDGRYRGTDLPAGTYYYVINPKNGRKVIAGNVTIIR